MRIVCYLLVLFTIPLGFSCVGKMDRLNTKNRLISLVYMDVVNNIDTAPVLPPPPPLSGDYSQKEIDSINSLYVNLINRIASQAVQKKIKPKKKIVAIAKTHRGSEKYEFKLDSTFSDYKQVFEKFKTLKEDKKFCINRIYTTRNDSIIYFNDSLLTKDSRDFNKFDFYVGFSRVAFNDEYDKAMVVVSANVSKLAGASVLDFLEKSFNGRWVIKFKKGLTIS